LLLGGVPKKGKRKGAYPHLPEVSNLHQLLVFIESGPPEISGNSGAFPGFMQFGTPRAGLMASNEHTRQPEIQTQKRIKIMTNLRTFSTPIINAAAAFALSFALISGTVSIPANITSKTASVAASSEYIA